MHDLISSLGGMLGALLALIMVVSIALAGVVAMALFLLPLIATKFPKRDKTGLELRDEEESLPQHHAH